ncbi:hypothetical protein ACFQPF_14730 [Fictibacillus iocasae]|uniref:Uncharacterized protein n=1 Tax=Fictibacillus iocasae TaxID=2715437 RepID=A0ABW2NY27_9BACL
METNRNVTLIIFPDAVPELFISTLKRYPERSNVALCVPEWTMEHTLDQEGFHQIFVFSFQDGMQYTDWISKAITKVIIYETSFIGCCMAIDMVRSCYTLPVVVLKSDSRYLSRIYKDLGADFVIHNKNGNIQYLLTS